MSIVQFATIIVAAFAAWLTMFVCDKGSIPSQISVALAIFFALIVYTLGPSLFQ